MLDIHNYKNVNFGILYHLLLLAFFVKSKVKQHQISSNFDRETTVISESQARPDGFLTGQRRPEPD